MTEGPPDASNPLDAIVRNGAQRWPDAAAVINGDRRWTYRELDAEVSAVAERLAACGVGAGEGVAMLAGHSHVDIFTLAGIIRLGAFVVPIDPATPAERLRFLLTDSACTAVVSRSDPLTDPVDPDWPVTRISFADLGDPRISRVRPRPISAVPGLAYVIYTSGSTGRPKGVMVSAASAAAHAASAAECFDLRAEDRVLQFASLGFDVAQEEIWPTWSAGAALVLNDRGLPAVSLLEELVRVHALTVLQLPTAYWRAVLLGDNVRTDLFHTVRMVIIGGEAAWREDLLRWTRSPLAHIELVNGYGPTEGVVTATAYRFRSGDAVPDTSGIPIGQPLRGRELFVLDDSGQPVPDGSEGELHLAGILADGYVGEAQLTSRAFPTLDLRGQLTRVYRTGDRVRRTADGALEFLRRNDNQVKIRGYRVELEEVEAALNSHPQVLASGVGLIEREHGEPLLGALLAAGEGADPSQLPGLVAAHAARHLPPYLVPSVVVVAVDLPTTSNHKLDRAAIADVVSAELGRTVELADPMPTAGEEDPTISALLPIWRAVLGHEQIGADDDFFWWGGDSLLAMQFAARSRTARYVVQPAAVLTGRTLRAVSATARSADPDAPLSAGVPSTPRLLPAQHRWLKDGEIPEVDYFALGALLVVPAHLSRSQLEAVAAALMEQHDVLNYRVSRAGTGY